MTPDFAEFLLQTPRHERQGLVFKINALTTGRGMTPKRISRIISAIGKKARIVVFKADGKHGSAHDLRRAFGTRWAPRLKPATLRVLMRHKTIETTLKYYVSQDADDMAAELWREYQPAMPKRSAEGSGNTSGNSGAKSS